MVAKEVPGVTMKKIIEEVASLPAGAIKPLPGEQVFAQIWKRFEE